MSLIDRNSRRINQSTRCAAACRILCVCTAFYSVLVGPVYAADYYVSTSGADSAVGSREAPWRTIQHAASRLRPGDTVHVCSGNYPEHVTINVSGKPNRQITFKAVAGEKPTLIPGSFYANGKSHIRIEGFHVSNTSGSRAAIEVNGNGRFVEIVGNEISKMSATAAAIRVGGTMHDFVIQRNHVHHNDTGNQEAIRVHERTRNFTVSHNEVNDNTNIGIDIVGWAQYGKPTDGVVSHNFCHNNSTLAPWASEIYLDGSKNIIVEHNIVTGSEFGFQFGCEPSTDSSSGNILRHNIAFGCSEYGFMIGGFTGGTVHHCQVYNNTFVNNKRAIGFNKNGGHDNLIVNNILYEASGDSIVFNGRPKDTLIDFNCYFTQRGPTPGANSIRSNPLFADLSKRDFRLRPNSPCINVGTLIDDSGLKPRTNLRHIGAAEKL